MLRPILAAALLVLPLAGCFGGPAASVTLFDLRGALAGDPTPLAPRDCDELLDVLNARALDEARANLEASVHGGHGMAIGLDVAVSSDSVAMADSAGSASTRSSAPAPRQPQATGTNNQEAAADEGDVLKTDGAWTYVLTQAGTLHILRHEGLGGVSEEARMTLSPTWGAGHLLLEPRGPDPDDDRLVVVLPNVAPGDEARAPLTEPMRVRASAGMTRILVLDLADRGAPAIVSETFIEGHVAGVRLVDGVAHVVVQSWVSDLGLQHWPDLEGAQGLMAEVLPHWAAPAMQQEALERAALQADADNRERIAELTLRNHLPLVLSSQGGPVSPDPLGEAQCRSILATPGPTGRAVTTIESIDVAGDLASATQQILGASAVVYASGDALVLAAASAEAWWATSQADILEATDLHWFDLDGLAVTHRASGRVPGSILDSFALDVHGDRLRVASTLNTWRWLADGPMASAVTVLQPMAGLLVPTGSVGGIAPTERLWSVRFTDERAYLVTFRNMDPLWIVDLSGAAPRILGELEIPGVSTYLHPLGDDALLAIGYGAAGADGQGLDRSVVQLSLFDVSDPARPRRAAVLDLSSQAHSAAVDEHKAFAYWPELGLAAIPVTTWGEGNASHQLRLIDVDEDRMSLKAAGAIEQTQLPRRDWNAAIERSFFLGFAELGIGSVYALSPRGLSAHDLMTLEPQGSVAFPDEGMRMYAID